MKGNQKSFELTPLAAALAGAVAAFAMQGASAQESQPAAAPTGQAAPVTLERVTVTGKREDGYKVEEAQSPKFTAPLLDTPKSVTVVPAEVIQQSGSNSLQDALRRADFVSLHVNLTRPGESDTPTYHLMNEERLKLMKPTAYLVNTSRGPVVDEQAQPHRR